MKNEFDVEKADLVRSDAEKHKHSFFVTATDAFNSQSASIATMRKYLGNDTKALLWENILPSLNAINVGRGMNQESIGEFIDFIYCEYYFLKIEELKTFFYQAKTGKFGTVYDRLDMQTLCLWLGKYDETRTGIAVAASESNKGVTINEPIAMPANLKALMQKFEKPKVKLIPTIDEFRLQDNIRKNYNYLVASGLNTQKFDDYSATLYQKLYQL